MGEDNWNKEEALNDSRERNLAEAETDEEIMILDERADQVEADKEVLLQDESMDQFEADSDQTVRQEIPRWKKFFLIYPHINRSSYIIRAIAGAYIAYLGMSNLINLATTESEDQFIIGLLSLLLVIFSAYFVFSGVYALIKQEYK
ncbi:MAG: hypothetical protein ACK5ML_03220 [Lachnospiraceae bacterium]